MTHYSTDPQFWFLLLLVLPVVVLVVSYNIVKLVKGK